MATQKRSTNSKGGKHTKIQGIKKAALNPRPGRPRKLSDKTSTAAWCIDGIVRVKGNKPLTVMDNRSPFERGSGRCTPQVPSPPIPVFRAPREIWA